jgi:uncharacterized protein with gpF-like domain
MNNEFNILLRLHRRNVKNATTDIVSPKWLYPLATEKVYAKTISKHIKTYINSQLVKLEGKLPKWVQENRRAFKGDSWEEEFKEFKEDLKKALLLYFGLGLLFDNEIGQLVQSTADKVMAYALKQWNKQTNAVLGDPYTSMPPDWASIKSLWMEENYSAIRNLAEEYNKKLTDTIVAGLTAGWVYNEFADQIQKLNKKFIGYRSALVGRGQTGNLVGSIIKNYAKGIGNDEYMWQTALDERVRGNPLGVYPKAIPSHWSMEGIVCKWSYNSVYSAEGGRTWKKRTPIMEKLPPGFAWACRCTAAIYWNNFVKTVGG